TAICLLCVPVLMGQQNWDDHDRSDRYTCRDFASNYLNSCEKDAIIFTNGDNDTFPLWYAQEVEGIRTDVRVVNLSYLGADWYLEQMHRKAYESEPLPFSLTREKVLQGKRDIAYLINQIKEPIELKDGIEFLASDDPKTKQYGNYAERLDYIPGKTFKVTVDTTAVFKNKYVPENMKAKVTNQMQWTIEKNYLTKADILVLDLIAHNNWKRPVYFAVTVSHDNYLNLEPYMQINGLTYKVIPVKSEVQMGDIMNIDIDTTYNNMMNKFKWGGINNPKVYLDENILRMLSNIRNSFAKLADALILANKKDSALKVVDRAMELMPDKCVPYNYFTMPYVDLYYKLNQPAKAQAISERLAVIAEQELTYIFRLKPEDRVLLDYDMKVNLRILQQLSMIEKQYGNTEKANKLEMLFQEFYGKFANM
ncbi:MAG TPA: hypothetical protein PK252_14645, partial [Bacteroidales bacterium]|nr:hypothetical protein [Bacteroidales bacterium]